MRRGRRKVKVRPKVSLTEEGKRSIESEGEESKLGVIKEKRSR